ncbi:MAG TPA: hypothetical protein PLC59_00370 [Bacteroidales bacterium]|jgi:hypothetical protein|nr:hypothetical protein [Bacteroidales bacterium]HQI44518.1 hypothetical protein [Bacteroidales bacterium]
MKIPPDFYIPIQVTPIYSFYYGPYMYFPNKRQPIETATVIVKEDEYQFCVWSSENMGANTWKSNNIKEDKWKRGYINTPNDPRKVERRGRIGELAFCKLTGTAVDFRNISGGDVFGDTIYLGKKTNVKNQSKPYGVGQVRHQTGYGKTLPIRQDLYVFGWTESEDRSRCVATVRFWGASTKKMIEQSPIVKRKWVNYEINYESLLPIRNLLKFQYN